jgi:hypothetical protein
MQPTSRKFEFLKQEHPSQPLSSPCHLGRRHLVAKKGLDCALQGPNRIRVCPIPPAVARTSAERSVFAASTTRTWGNGRLSLHNHSSRVRVPHCTIHMTTSMKAKTQHLWHLSFRLSLLIMVFWRASRFLDFALCHSRGFWTWTCSRWASIIVNLSKWKRNAWLPTFTFWCKSSPASRLRERVSAPAPKRVDRNWRESMLLHWGCALLYLRYH